MDASPIRPRALAAIALGLCALATTAPPAAAQGRGLTDSALGIPCLPQADGVRLCSGTPATLVESWDGVPLDVDLYLPPDDGKPDPLIVGLHGFGATKLGAFAENDDDNPAAQQALAYAGQGYAVMAYSARGIGFSCGPPAVRSLHAGCERGWEHLADARYEVRDTQHLAGLLVDEGLVEPRRIGVTGSSYGGGQSLMLATLRDRVMLPSGKLVRWRSHDGEPMQIAAAAPRIGWSDLPYALVPTGRTLDFRVRNRYGRSPGIVKYSYLNGLYTVALTSHMAPPGEDPDADIRTWKAELDKGEPYDLDGPIGHALRQLTHYHSGYYILARRPRSWKPPAPIVAYNAWTDDIMPPHEPLRYDALLRERFPEARMGTILSAEFAHNRGSLGAAPQLANDARDELFAHYLMGDASAKPLRGTVTETQGCGVPIQGPFRARSWRAQHPGETRGYWRKAQTFDSGGGSTETSLATDPFAGGECPRVSAARDPGAATFDMKPATGDGFTLMGSPTVTARLRITGRYPQIVARLWDVAPDGRQTMVQHSPYRPRVKRRQVFQLQPSGWRFAPGHFARLELLGRDFPYSQPSGGTFAIRARRVRLELPVRDRPDGDQVKRFRPPRIR